MAGKKPGEQTGQPGYTTLFDGNISALDTFNDEGALAPNVLSDAENVFYDTGYVYNRNGAQVFCDDPSYEPTSPLIQAIVCSDSRGNQYLLRYWNGHFDVWNPATLHWYNVNPPTVANYQAAVVTQKTSKWGYAPWNNGWGNDVFQSGGTNIVGIAYGADLLYLGNGTDPMVRWVMANAALTNALVNGATSITLSDTSEFPGLTGVSSQNIIIGGTVVQYNAKTPSAWQDVVTLANDPADGDTLTFTVTPTGGSPTTVTVTFKTSLSGPGQVKRGGGNAVTAASLAGLLLAPALDDQNNTWNGFTDQPSITALQLLIPSYTASSHVVTLTEANSGSISAFTSATTTSGNTTVPAAPNVLTLTSGWAGTTVVSGTPCYVPMQSVLDPTLGFVTGGKWMKVINSRLHMAGMKGKETFISYSALNYPQAFAAIGTDTGIGAGGIVEMSDGDGPITGLSVTLTYLLIHKRDIINEFFLQEDTTNNDNIPSFVPVAQGDSEGSISGFLTQTANLITYFPTATQGIAVLIPSFSYTGVLSFTEDILSKPIQNIATSVGYALGDSIYLDGKLWFSVNESASPAIPNLIIWYDLIRKSFGKIRGWNATSFAEYQGTLIFTGIDAHLYQYDEQTYDDNNFAYGSYGKTAELSFGDPAALKQADSIYVSGLIGLDMNLYVDVMYGKNGVLRTDTYLISGSPQNPCVTLTTMPLIGQNMIGINTIGVANNDAEIGIFQCYLTQNIQFLWNTVQLRFYSQDAGSSWAVDCAAVRVAKTEAVNSDLRIYPEGT